MHMLNELLINEWMNNKITNKIFYVILLLFKAFISIVILIGMYIWRNISFVRWEDLEKEYYRIDTV